MVLHKATGRKVNITVAPMTKFGSTGAQNWRGKMGKTLQEGSISPTTQRASTGLEKWLGD